MTAGGKKPFPLSAHVFQCTLLIAGHTRDTGSRDTLLLMWHTLLAALRLPQPSLSLKYAIVAFHVLQAIVVVLIFSAAASPSSTTLTRVTRVLAYSVGGRPDVDIGPAAWHAMFLGMCLWAVVLGGVVIWLARSGRSLIK